MRLPPKLETDTDGLTRLAHGEEKKEARTGTKALRISQHGTKKHIQSGLPAHLLPPSALSSHGCRPLLPVAETTTTATAADKPVLLQTPGLSPRPLVLGTAAVTAPTAAAGTATAAAAAAAAAAAGPGPGPGRASRLELVNQQREIVGLVAAADPVDGAVSCRAGVAGGWRAVGVGFAADDVAAAVAVRLISFPARALFRDSPHSLGVVKEKERKRYKRTRERERERERERAEGTAKRNADEEGLVLQVMMQRHTISLNRQGRARARAASN